MTTHALGLERVALDDRLALGAHGGRRGRGDGWRRFRRHRPAVAGLVVIVVLVVAALIAPLLTALGVLADPNHIDTRAINAGLSSHHLLGADNLGRDILARIMYGTRVSLSVGVVVQGVALLVGGTIGLTAGYAGGWADTLLMRLTDVMYAFPELLFVLFVAAVLGAGFWHVFVAVGAVSWVYLARLVRNQVRSVRREPYIESARAAGTSAPKIVVRHVVPNVAAPVVVSLAFGVPAAIFMEAFLSFIGVGVRPPTASWGAMISDGYQAIFAHPTQVLWPALSISVATLAFNFVGDGLRDSLDPRMRR